MMQTKQLGQSDLQITPIIMGTWQAGKKMWAGIEDEGATRLVQK